MGSKRWLRKAQIKLLLLKCLRVHSRTISTTLLPMITMMALLVGFQNCSGGLEAASSKSSMSVPAAYAAGLLQCSFNGVTVQNGQSVTAFLNSTDTTCQSQARKCTDGVLSGSYSYASCAPSQDAGCLFNGQTIQSGTTVTAYQNSSVPDGQSCISETRACANGSLGGSYAFGSCMPAAPASCIFNGQTVASNTAVVAYQSSTGTCTSQARVCTNGQLSGTYTYASCNPSVAPAPAAASCLFNGHTIASGQTVPGFMASTVPYGQTCTSQTMTCLNGTLPDSTTFPFASCNVAAAASCLFNGQTIASGQTVVEYQVRSAADAQTCRAHSATFTCENGRLPGTSQFPFASCSVVAPASCLFNGQTIANGQTVPGYAASTLHEGGVCSSFPLKCQNGSMPGSEEFPFASCSVAGAVSGTGTSCNAGQIFYHAACLTLNGADLRNADLTGIDFSNQIISNANFQGANFSGDVMTNVSFNNVNLQNANFRSATLQNSDFIQSNFSNANFTGANLGSTIMELGGNIYSGVIFSQANLANAKIYGSFQNSDMSNASFVGALIDGHFINCNISNTNFQNASAWWPWIN